MLKIIVTPAGRKEYLEILVLHLNKQKNHFNEWHLWLNTNVQEDIDYCILLEKLYTWIKVIKEPDINCVSSTNIHKFFKYACDPHCVYLRLDDDVVYIAENAIRNIFDFRIANPEYFLIFGNIINNAIVSHIHQRNNLIKCSMLAGYDCLDELGWKTPEYAEHIHNTFINDIKNNNIDLWKKSFNIWTLNNFERVSINCISWLGSDFFEFNGNVHPDEENWLSSYAPSVLNRHNVIISDAIVVHYAFHTQREYLNKTDILKKYKNIAEIL